MEIIKTAIPDVLLFKPKSFGDERGFFMETFRESWLENIGITANFIQDNHSASVKGVLRGLHYQLQQPQGKLVRVISGEVYDVAVDLRKNSPTFGQHVASILSAENKLVFWVPPGFAHGFLVLSDKAEFVYKCTSYYAPDDEHSLLWNDPKLGIPWPLEGIDEPALSAKDRKAASLSEAVLPS
ncbi:MAG: dTDP-4-dehydrorhamnose 3,5-epimerase [SAR86 cluster bacterium]|uniref:dTDP-4-dehydrorhamnose 3,5-epimerase n=1 Tax=SAR86 cluster bacterium TaxID=2030880 RepID=A0A2A5CJV2_9GAMM|nr:dTDP-4-dehydrorhamnose 3,5-epimerase [Gammaproteobacteria bacterium AH-315-E17]PCJ43646.1 MAG: dTDP-4-dehydrorhamnose 3,5-epimerase [SAR86 cluster bacterium]